MVEIILRESDEKLKGYDPEDVECIPLLICKTEPFVKGMQKSLKFFINRDKGVQRVTKLLKPTPKCA